MNLKNQLWTQSHAKQYELLGELDMDMDINCVIQAQFVLKLWITWLNQIKEQILTKRWLKEDLHDAGHIWLSYKWFMVVLSLENWSF